MWWIPLIASLLSRPVWSVEQVWNEADRQGIDRILACSVVEWESGFYIEMDKPAYKGSTDFGWWQVNSFYHPQFRDSWYRRNVYGVSFLKTCLDRADGEMWVALSYYHRWTVDERGEEYARQVLSIYERIRNAIWTEAIRRRKG